MSPSIRRMVWVVFVGLTLLTAAGVAMTLAILRMEQRTEHRIVEEARPLLDAVRTMDESLTTMVAASRGYVVTEQTAFAQQYDDAVRVFERAAEQASELATEQRHRKAVNDFRAHYRDVKELTDPQIKNGPNGPWRDLMIETARIRRGASDYAGLLHDQIRAEQRADLDQISAARQWVMMAMVFLGLAVIGLGAVYAWRIERQLGESITRQVRRTEAMIAGMADGVMLVDKDGKTVFINPAGQRLLRSEERR